MVKRLLLLLLLFLLIMMTYTLSSLNIPTDQNRYQKSLQYYSESGQQFNLPPYKQDNLGVGMASQNNDITLLPDAQAAFDLLMQEIAAAEHNINIEFFIIRDDESGNQFKHLLMDKAQQGVQIRLLYDAWGSAQTPKSYFGELRQNGVRVAAFNPLWSGLWQGRLDNRLHRKLIVIDGEKAFIGGENIGDEYLGKNPKIGFWKDTGLSLEGDSVLSIQQIFFNDWLHTTHEKLESGNFYPAAASLFGQTAIIFPGGPDSSSTDMGIPYINLINSAKDKIYMVSPYFIPNHALLNAMYAAARSNIEVQLILPAQSDNTLVNWIQPYYIKQLLAHGIKVSTYHSGFIHSKIMIIDNEAASIGSANFDRLSLNRNYEIITVLYDKYLIKQLQDDFLSDLENSTTLFPSNS